PQRAQYITQAAASDRGIPRGMIGRDGLRQPEIKEYRICKAHRSREEKWHVNAPAAQNAADGWSEDKPEAKRSADQTHALGAIFPGGDVGDIGLCCRDVSAGDAVENATDKEQQER